MLFERVAETETNNSGMLVTIVIMMNAVEKPLIPRNFEIFFRLLTANPPEMIKNKIDIPKKIKFEISIF